MLDDLLKRREELEAARKKAVKDLDDPTEGKVRIFRCKGRWVCYLRKDKSDKYGRYVRTKERALVEAIVKKGYAEKVVRKIDVELTELDRYIAIVQKDEANREYGKMCEPRREMVEPVLLTDEEAAQRWAAEPYTLSQYKPEFRKYPTKRGELVRSKSEVMLANMFYELGIPYRYEQVVKTRDGKVYAPDFTLWHKRRREEQYHEHFGMMDDPDYRRDRFLRQIDAYRKSGIYFGKNLTATFEGDGAVFDINEIRKMFEEMFL